MAELLSPKRGPVSLRLPPPYPALKNEKILGDTPRPPEWAAAPFTLSRRDAAAPKTPRGGASSRARRADAAMSVRIYGRLAPTPPRHKKRVHRHVTRNVHPKPLTSRREC